MQVEAIRNARTYLGDKLIRTAPLHKILDPASGPLIAVNYTYSQENHSVVYRQI